MHFFQLESKEHKEIFWSKIDYVPKIVYTDAGFLNIYQLIF